MDLSGNVSEFSIYTNSNSLSFGYIYGAGELASNGLSTTWNGLHYDYKGGSYYASVSNTQSFSNSKRLYTTVNPDDMDFYLKASQGIRGCR